MAEQHTVVGTSDAPHLVAGTQDEKEEEANNPQFPVRTHPSDLTIPIRALLLTCFLGGGCAGSYLYYCGSF